MQAKNLKMYCYNFSMASFVNIKIHIYYCLVSWFFSPLSTFSLLWSLTNNTGSQSIPPVLLCSGIVRHVKRSKTNSVLTERALCQMLSWAPISLNLPNNQTQFSYCLNPDFLSAFSEALMFLIKNPSGHKLFL